MPDAGAPQRDGGADAGSFTDGGVPDAGASRSDAGAFEDDAGLDGGFEATDAGVDAGSADGGATVWSNLTPSTSGPGGRNAEQIVFDSGRGVTVLFGGLEDGSWVTDTWEWNGSDWTQRVRQRRGAAELRARTAADGRAA